MMRSACRFVSAVIVALLLSAISAPPAHAAKFSGAYLLQLCELGKSGKEVVKGGSAACQSYISGVLDYHSVLQSLKIAPKLDVCVPASVTLNELQGIVLDYLRTNPQHDGFIAAPAVMMAIYQVYPCKKAYSKKKKKK